MKANTKAISAAITSRRTVSDVKLCLMRPIMERAPRWGQ
jgi:hypothetical protein